jgi:glutathione peroxidase
MSYKMIPAVAVALAAIAAVPAIAEKPATAATLAAFKLTAIDGAPMPMSAYKGKVVLLVNTASMCGFTPQYDALQKVHATYEAKGFTVIGVPSGDFAGQEFGSNKEIKEFCESKFNIRFPMTEKAVVSGDKAIPLFKWAADATKSPPKWNFHKYVIGRDGKVIAAFGSAAKPDSPAVIAEVEKALAKKAG